MYTPLVNHIRVHTHVQHVKFLNFSAQAGNSCLELVENCFPDDRLFVICQNIKNTNTSRLIVLNIRN